MAARKPPKAERKQVAPDAEMKGPPLKPKKKKLRFPMFVKED